MKHLLLSLLILSSLSVTAQSADLFVRPNPSNNTDSYVYADNVVLYVEDNVNLERNTNDETEGSIYLRNGAQLIQGDDTKYNTGDGLLSVYQNAPDSDRWTYNYWCYPVGNANATTNTNTWSGLARVYDIKIGDPNEKTFSELAQTTTGRDGSINPLTISTRWVYIHPDGFEAESDYIRINGSNSVPPGMGFIMKGVGDAPVGGGGSNFGPGFEYDFRGRPNTGEIEVPLVYNSSLGKGEYTLSGNPYPSALDLNRLWYDADNVGKLEKISFWDEDKKRNSHYYSQNAGGYGTWIPMGSDPNGYIINPGVSTPATFTIWNAAGDMVSGDMGTGVDIDRRFSPIGQGFMLVPTAAGGGDVIKIKNEHRRYIKEGEYGSTFRRPENSSNDTSITKNVGSGDSAGAVIAEEDNRIPHLRIDAFFDKSHVREMVLAFSDDATDGYDNGFDATSPMDASSEAYFPVGPDNDRKPYVINTVPFDVKKQIPISLKLNKPFKVSLRAVEAIKMQGRRAYIFDSEQRTFQEFTNGRSATFNLPAGTFDNRFFVVFKEETNSGDSTLAVQTLRRPETEAEVINNVDFFQNNRLGVLEVSNPEGYNIKQALVFDMTGKLVFEKANIGSERKFSFPTLNLSDGVYLVKLKTADNVDISYKTSVYNKN